MGTCFVLGAGASIVSGIPSVEPFKARCAELASSGSFASDRHRELFHLGWSVWAKWGRRLNIEEVYVMADLKSRVWGDFNQRLAEVHAVRFLIAEAIEQLAHDGGRPTHAAFLHHVHAAPGNSIVTTNWDITLDSAMLRAGRHVNYANGASPLFPDQLPQDAGAGTPLLKLHGSLNWGRCSRQECGWTAFRDGKVAAALHLDDPRPCGTCGQRGLEPAFVPPMAQKMEETNTPLRNVWQIAFRTLRQATSVVIVGHSLPRTDLQVEMLLVDAIGREDSSVETVHVVGPPDGGRDERFRRLRAKLGRDVPFWAHDQTYESWAANGCLLNQGRPLDGIPAAG